MDILDLIPIRVNGQRVTRNWFNELRIALGVILEGMTPKIQQSLANNTTAVVTDLIFDHTEVVDAEVNYTIIRGSIRQAGKLRVYWDGTAWGRGHEAEVSANVDFSIHATTGQVSYITDNGVVGKIQWQIISTFAVEV